MKLRALSKLIVAFGMITLSACGTTNNLNVPKVASGSEIAELQYDISGYTNKIYNLTNDCKFKLTVKTTISLPDNAIEVYDENGNKVDILRYDTVNENSQTLDILPTKGKWGRESEYKIYVYYDINNEDLVKLDEPLVIPFKIASDVDVPVLSCKIDELGNFKLCWNKVSGAVGYKIYKRTANTNKIIFVADVDANELEWNDWNNSQLGNDASSNVILSQNDGLDINDIYYITAYGKNGESNNSNCIKVKDYAGAIITKVKDNKQLDPGVYINDTKDLPRTVDVETLGGNSIKCSIEYELDEHTRYSDNIYYNYIIKGTGLKGYTEVKIKNTVSLPSKVYNGVEIYRDFNNIKFEVISSGLEEKNEVDLSDWIKSQGKLNVNKEDSYSEYKNSREKAEAYIKDQIITGNTEIDINGYGYAQSLDGLTDVITDISYNPFVYSIKNVKLDEVKNKIYIEYVENSIDVYERNNLLNNKIKQIIKEIKENNSVIDEKVIYDYISTNYRYSKEGNIYSMVHDGKGNAVAHAKLFEILIKNLTNYTVYTVEGYLNGVGHTWNVLKKDTDYVYIDCTNNVNNIGIDKICYDMSIEKAEKYGYIKKDTIVDIPKSNNNDNEYYVKNKLEANSKEEYLKIVSERLKNGDNPICVRYTGEEIKSSDIVLDVSKVFKDAQKEKLLGKLHFGDGLGYYVLWYDKAVVKSSENSDDEELQESLSENEEQVEQSES